MSAQELRRLDIEAKRRYGLTFAQLMQQRLAAIAAGGVAAAAEEEKTEWDVVLKDFGANKINVIKAVRKVTTLGLKGARDRLEGMQGA